MRRMGQHATDKAYEKDKRQTLEDTRERGFHGKFSSSQWWTKGS
ncbi:hypothetical protein CTS44_06629 [Comamonas thiooxydans]|nr:hypothetical protein CTS44_06629 [Comamonas thiooxydans]